MAHNALVSRRPVLPDYSKAQHPGLLLERGLRSIKKSDKSDTTLANETLSDKEQPVSTLMENACKIGIADYSGWFMTWQATLSEFGVKLFSAQTSGRVVAGLGNESVLETAISIHRTYGVPYIPGSALKGLASSYAHQRLQGWDKTTEAHRILFGDTTSAGYVTFWDALPISYYLHPDIMTVHHGEYYSSGKESPADWDDPNPIPFISASGSFLIALSGPDDWIKVAHGILKLALAEYGIGAKTSSGYGRMVLVDADYVHKVVPEQEAPPETTSEQQARRGKIRGEHEGKFRISYGQLTGTEHSTKWLSREHFEGEPRLGCEVEFSSIPTEENVSSLSIKVLGKSG